MHGESRLFHHLILRLSGVTSHPVHDPGTVFRSFGQNVARRIDNHSGRSERGRGAGPIRPSDGRRK